MNEITLTQLGALVGVTYTLFQFARAKADQAAIVADLRARLGQVESQMQTLDARWGGIERSVAEIATAIARLEERMTALDAKLSNR